MQKSQEPASAVQTTQEEQLVKLNENFDAIYEFTDVGDWVAKRVMNLRRDCMVDACDGFIETPSDVQKSIDIINDQRSKKNIGVNEGNRIISQLYNRCQERVELDRALDDIEGCIKTFCIEHLQHRIKPATKTIMATLMKRSNHVEREDVIKRFKEDKLTEGEKQDFLN